MKTKKGNREISKQRQVTGQQLARWEQNIRDLESALMRAPADPELLKKLSFCRQEHTKCKSNLNDYNYGTKVQRYWNSQGFTKI